MGHHHLRRGSVVALFLICISHCLGQDDIGLRKLHRAMLNSLTTGFAQSQCLPINHYSIGCRHGCDRKCQPNEPPRICHYRFSLETFETHSSYACSPLCSLHGDCHKCIKTDGVRSEIIVNNWEYPSPVIAVCQNDIILVEVANHMENFTKEISDYDLELNVKDHLSQNNVAGSLGSGVFLAREEYNDLPWKRTHYHTSEYREPVQYEPTTCHFHGMVQRYSQESDGVPFVTQDSSGSNQIYTYGFIAENGGTYFFHSHYGMQRGIGFAGALIIRSANDPHRHLYDFDLTHHYLLLTDYGHYLSHKLDCVHINGKGVCGDGGESHEVVVMYGFSYRIRVIANSVNNIHLEVFVEGHTIIVIAVDGVSIEPIEVDSIVLANGERVDFVLHACKPISNYFIYVRPVGRNESLQHAVLHYVAADPPNLYESIGTNISSSRGLQLNTPNTPPGTPGSIAITELKGIKPATACVRSNQCIRKYFELGVSGRGFQINNITMMFPEKPMLSQLIDDGRMDESNFCNEQSLVGRNCDTEICKCTHVVKLQMWKCYEFVSFVRSSGHPIHLHGFVFNVVAMGQAPPGRTMSKELFEEMDRNNEIKRNLDNPPGKDVVSIPRNGYVVIRFCTDNPGLWLFHCHIELHSNLGMSMVFMVGNEQEIVNNSNKNYQPHPYENNYC